MIKDSDIPYTLRYKGKVSEINFPRWDLGIVINDDSDTEKPPESKMEKIVLGEEDSKN